MIEPDNELTRDIAGVALLQEPVRRRLYRYVVEQPHAVCRDEAARATGVKRELAAFHLDKLVEEGLLETRFQRLTGRQGPGAGRPAKLYFRSTRQLDVTVPARRYELAARLLAQALDSNPDPAARAHVAAVAHDFGVALGEEAARQAGETADEEQRLRLAETFLAAYGFEPHRCDGTVRLRNCPFHALASEHTALVCGMNLALLRGVLEGIRLHSMEAIIQPRPDMCCVTFRPAPGAE